MPTSKITVFSEVFIFITASMFGQLFDGAQSAFMTFFWSMIGWLCYRYLRIPILLFLKRIFTTNFLTKFFSKESIDNYCDSEEKDKKK